MIMRSADFFIPLRFLFGIQNNLKTSCSSNRKHSTLQQQKQKHEVRTENDAVLPETNSKTEAVYSQASKGVPGLSNNAASVKRRHFLCHAVIAGKASFQINRAPPRWLHRRMWLRSDREGESVRVCVCYIYNKLWGRLVGEGRFLHIVLVKFGPTFSLKS